MFIYICYRCVILRNTCKYFKPGFSKLQPVGQKTETQNNPPSNGLLPIFVNKVCWNTSILLCLYIVYGCFFLPLQSWITVTEIVWFANPKYLLFGCLWKKFAFPALNKRFSKINIHKKHLHNLWKHRSLGSIFTGHHSLGWDGAHELAFLRSSQAAGLQNYTVRTAVLNLLIGLSTCNDRKSCEVCNPGEPLHKMRAEAWKRSERDHLNNMKFLGAEKAQHQMFLQPLIPILIQSEHWKFNRDQQKPKAVRLEM